MNAQQFIVPAAVALAGVFQLGWTIIRLPRVLAASRWKEVDGTILSSDIEPASPYTVSVTYRYLVDGEAFVGDQIHPGGFRPRTYEQSSLVFHKYRPGAAVTVYYDPQSPGRAALETDASWPVFISFSAGLLLLYLAARLAANNGLL